MRTWAICFVMLGMLENVGISRAQPPATQAPASHVAAIPPDLPRAQTGLSDWITGGSCRDGCFGNVGGDPPIGTELFLRIGPSAPTGSTFFGRIMQTGWMIEGGGRALWFHRNMNAAWLVEFSLSNTNNHADLIDPITIPRRENPVVIQSYNRTFVNLGAGREWYFYPATDNARNLRTGVDFGGRYGSASLGLFDTKHLTDVVGGAYVAWHADLEFPFRCCYNPCIFQAGLRLEYDYTWSDILGFASDMQDFNILFNFGVRY